MKMLVIPGHLTSCLLNRFLMLITEVKLTQYDKLIQAPGVIKHTYSLPNNTYVNR